MNLPLIIACITIVLALIVFPLIVSFKAEKKNESANDNKSDAVSYTNLTLPTTPYV